MATFTTPTAISPGDCVLWLDASDSTTLYQLSTNPDTGVDPVTAINDKIGFWADKSGNNNSAKIASIAARPTYSLLDGLSGVYFNGVNNALDIMQLSSIYVSDPDNNGYSIFLVVRSDTSITPAPDTIQTLFTQTSSSVTYNGYTGTTNNHISIFYTAASYVTRLRNVTYNTQQYKDNCDSYNTSYISSNRFVISNILTAKNNKLYAEGICANAAASTGTYGSILSAKQIRIGALAANLTPSTTTDYRFKGYIHEILVYDIALSLLQQKLVEAYLSKKWQASSYVSYAVRDGDFDDNMTWFNEEVPTLSSTVVIPNGYTVSLSGSSIRPRLHNRVLDTISKAGTFKITQTTSLTTEYILNDLRYGKENQTAGLVAGDNSNATSTSPTVTVQSGAQLNLQTPLIQALWRGAPCFYTDNSNVTITNPTGVEIYGSLTSQAISAVNSTVNIPVKTTIKMGFNYNGPNGFGNVGRSTWAIQAVNSTLTIGTTLANSDLAAGVPPRGNTFANVNSGKIYATNCHLTITNATIDGYGMEGGSGGSGLQDTTDRWNTVVYCYNTGTATSTTFNNCTLAMPNASITTNDTRHLNVMLNGNGCNGYFNDCIIAGYPTLQQGGSDLRPDSVYIISNANATFTNCKITGSKHWGSLNTTTNRYSNIGNYGAGVRIGGSVNTVNFNQCELLGDTGEGGPALSMHSGNVYFTGSNVYAGAQSNGIYRAGGNLYYSGNQYDNSTGYRAIFAAQYYVTPIPKNSLIRYATNGLGIGIDAYTYQYTIDSLSAFSMPAVSAVRKGTPYAGGALIGTSVIPPAAAVSYGTLVDNTTGTAILTFDLLNTFFETPLSALSVPNLSSTVGYRVANALTSNESIGHLIASFTTG